MSRTSLALRMEASERWNPFTAAKEAIKARWNPIDKMRGDMCWDRDNLLDHEECMEFMVDKCKNDNGKSKRCQKLRKFVQEHCDAGDKDACKYAEALGMALAAPVAPAPAPAPMTAPAPGPSPSAPAPAPAEKEEAPAPAPAAKEEAPAPAPKKEEPKPVEGEPKKLQSQGFEGKKVRHIDGETYSSDWRDEYAHPTTTTKAVRSGSRPVTAIAGIFALLMTACSFF